MDINTNTQVATYVQGLDVTQYDSNLDAFEALRAYQVTDAAGFEYAVRTSQNGKEFIREVTAKMDAIIAEARKPYEVLLAMKNKYVKPTDEIVKTLSGRALQWKQAEERRLKAEHDRKLAIEAKEREQKLLEEKKKAEAEIDIFADPISDAPAPLVPVALVAVPPAPKVVMPSGNSTKASPLKWRWKTTSNIILADGTEKTVEDPYMGMRQFMQAALEDNALMGYVDQLLNPAMVKALLTAKKEDAVKVIPGIETYRDEILVTKGA